MTVPLMTLAVGSVFAGWLGVPGLWNLFGESLRGFDMAGAGLRFGRRRSGERGPASASIEWILMGLSVAIAIIGIVVARYFYSSGRTSPSRIEKSRKPLHTLLYNKWYVDEIYDFLFVNGLCKGGGRVLGDSTAKWWMAA